MLNKHAFRSALALLAMLAATTFAQHASAQARRAAWRYGTNGTSLDTAFNDTNSNGGPGKLVQSGANGTMFMAVNSSNFGITLAGFSSNTFLVERLTNTGQPDSAFGTNGVVLTNFSSFPGVTL